jgi:hypothetical protein
MANFGGGPEDIHDLSLLGGLGTTNAFSVADFVDAEESRPPGASLEALGGHTDAIQGIVNTTLTRHLNEATPNSSSPQLSSFNTSTNNWRKRLREMMLRQDETVLSFLLKPASEHATIGAVEAALRRYAVRQDTDTSQIKTLRHILTQDLSGAAQIQQDIDLCVNSKGPSTLFQLRLQVNGLIELYKETGEKLLECENQLKLRLDKMDKIQKRVSMMIELQTNEAMPELVAAFERYLQAAFKDLSIESIYKLLLFYYQKHIALREAIQVFKTGSQLGTEPLCAICLADHVGMAIVPCGHTFCTNCARRMNVECGICRGRIRDRVKLYFS